MENMKPFINDVKNLLLEKIEDKELDILSSRIMSTGIFSFDYEQGELRYYIEEDIVDKLSPELIKQINSIWILNKNPSET
jgi:hypothetical protein